MCKSNRYIMGAKCDKENNKGMVDVCWEDGLSLWVLLHELKALHPIEVVEYTMANKIVEKPALYGGQSMYLRNEIASYQR